uniref:DDT domain-containing protein n=1 Tax=Kalanchoe fedtschenkoi TaxID=63787 RepID=A0A7N0UI40_KALFE
MAVPSSSSPSRSTKPQIPKPKPMKTKRTKSPGVRLVGGRIYDSENGKTCHQCRQKTMDFTASCKYENHGKQCAIRFCHKCLFNRYGEKAEEKALAPDWKCPKCRGKCNCSFCMKKRGHKPTGILTHTAKATGFSSVSEMLDVSGPDIEVEVEGAAPKKLLTPKKGITEGKVPSSTADLNIKKPKKRKHAHPDGISEKIMNNAGKVEPNVPANGSYKEKEFQNKQHNSQLEEIKPPANGSKSKGSKKKKCAVQPIDSKQTASQMGLIESKSLDEKTLKTAGATKKNAVETENLQAEIVDTKLKTLAGSKIKGLKKEKCSDFVTVAGIEVLSKDVGQTLQFLEFCAAFGKVFNMRKGQAESIIREIVGGRERRRAQYSAAIQFHIELISLIQKDTRENFLGWSPTSGHNSWLHAAWKCISKSKFGHALTSIEHFCTNSEGYNALDSSRKLMLLNFLCDEALDTEKIRSRIEDEFSKSLEREKQAREKVTVAKEKERAAKKKIKDELAKAIIAKSGSPLTISEHETIVSQIKIEAAEAHAQIIEAKKALPNKEPKSDAVRTEPLFVDFNGNTFWRLKGYSGEPRILLQEMKEADGIVQSDYWLAYDAESMCTLEKYISSRKQEKRRAGNLILSSESKAADRKI